MSRTSVTAIVSTRRRRPRPGRTLRAFARRPLPAVAAVVLMLIVAAVLLAPWLAPDDPLAQDLAAVLQPPSGAHPMGTDALGRDVLSRMLYGGQSTLLGVLCACVAFAVIGVVLGVLAGYLGGRTDRAIGAVVDVMMSLPNIIIVLAVLATFGQNISLTMAVFGVLASANLTRIVRAAALEQREELYVSAARLSGLGHWAIMTRHVLRGVAGPALVQLFLFAALALGLQTGLGFLGLGVVAPNPTWGSVVADATAALTRDPLFFVLVGGVMVVTSLCFGLIGDGIRDATQDARRSLSPSARTARPEAESRQATELAEDDLVLAVRDYSVGYGPDAAPTVIVEGVSFGLRRGEILGLVGESGSGKTVTALSLLGLLPRGLRVLGGHAALGGVDIAAADPKAVLALRGRRIALVSQEPQVALSPVFSVGAQLRDVVRRLRGLSAREARARSIDLLAAVHLKDPERVYASAPHELSGGMLQRVVIAMALAGDPEVLIADEPTTALDVTVQAEILALLRELRARRGMSIILVTHDLAVVADMCDRVVVLRHGVVVERGGVEEIFYAPRSEYTKELLSMTPNAFHPEEQDS